MCFFKFYIIQATGLLMYDGLSVGALKNECKNCQVSKN